MNGRLVGMSSLAYHALPRSRPFHLRRELGIALVALVLLLGGLTLGMTVPGSHPAHTQSLVPARTQTSP
jgi:hypothetical protein